MSTNHTVQKTTASHELIWHQLHSEREDVCEALIKNSKSAKPDVDRLLQTRLREIDDGLDRLINVDRIDSAMIRRRES